MKYVILASALALTGCASVINGIAPDDCYDATSGSVSVTRSDGVVLVAKPAETIRLCPPSIRKVSPTVAVAAGAPVVAPAKAASAP